ncbi:MAG: F0F1 ATP synthase subunit A [Planctomycetes bacterium]|nr:F0F1 ATP synthase subunit A [Planctomycetota bacterium]
MTRYLLCPRGLSLLAVVLAACTIVTLFSMHHASDIGALQSEPAGVFPALFGHLTPTPLSFDHHTPLALHAPWLPALFTSDSAGVDTDRFVVTNLQVFQVAAVLFVLIGFSGVASYLRTGRGDAISKMFAGFVRYIRDEMVFAVMGKEHGAHFVPYFLCIFFFIMFQNVFGLLPHSATATASIAVTGALATLTFGAMIGCGMAAQGPLAFWKNLVPHVPLPLWPLMFVIELIGLCVKPFALTIRLFANMTAGHLIVLSCMGLIMFFAKAGANAAVGYGSAPLAVGFGVFIMIIETFVAILQAYIFTMLSIIFVGAAVHPEH